MQCWVGRKIVQEDEQIVWYNRASRLQASLKTTQAGFQSSVSILGDGEKVYRLALSVSIKWLSSDPALEATKGVRGRSVDLVIGRHAL